MFACSTARIDACSWVTCMGEEEEGKSQGEGGIYSDGRERDEETK